MITKIYHKKHTLKTVRYYRLYTLVLTVAIPSQYFFLVKNSKKVLKLFLHKMFKKHVCSLKRLIWNWRKNQPKSLINTLSQSRVCWCYQRSNGLCIDREIVSWISAPRPISSQIYTKLTTDNDEAISFVFRVFGLSHFRYLMWSLPSAFPYLFLIVVVLVKQKHLLAVFYILFF